MRLEYVTIGWNAIEAAVAVGSGIVAGSVALVAFGLDSAIEVVSATIVLVHLRAALAGTEPNPARHRRALRTIAVTFFALAAYVTVDAAISLLRTDRPSASTLGLAVTGAAVIVMPTLAWAKRRTARALGERGHQGSAVLLNADAAETLLCALLSLATLIGRVARRRLSDLTGVLVPLLPGWGPATWAHRKAIVLRRLMRDSRVSAAP